MVTCELDREVSGELLGWKIPAWQALLLHRVLPSCGGLIVYIVVMCYDFTLLCEHFINGDEGIGVFCTILITLPSLISLVFTLASPPPGFQMDFSALSVNVEKHDLRWLAIQFINAIFFPIAAIGRYCYLIFWWVEAVCASRSDDKERTQEAIQAARAPSPIELYLFLQSFIHAAPHAIINILDLMARYSDMTFDKGYVGNFSSPVDIFIPDPITQGNSELIALSFVFWVTMRLLMRPILGDHVLEPYRYHHWEHALVIDFHLETLWYNMAVSVQAVSIIASSLRMASTATIYRRFEREKLNGRKYPWGKQTDPLLTNDDDNDDDVDDVDGDKTNEVKDEPIYETVTKKDSFLSDYQDGTKYYRNTNSDLMKFSPRSTVDMSSGFGDNEVFTDSDTSSDYLPHKRHHTQELAGELSSDEEYVRPITIIDRVAPLRRNTNYTVEKVEIVPPPVMLAPRPLSLAVWAEKMVENAESIPAWLSAPPRRKYCDEVVQDEPDIPRRVPRSYMRGLEPQDATAALVHFLGWYAFFVCRLLSIACLINFFPVVAIIILFSHYQAMLLFLIVPQASTVKRGFYVFLAFIYLFCLMEFKIRFRHVRVWHVFWIIVCTIETVVFTGLWACIDNSMHEWWRYFIVKVIIISLCLSYMCFLTYFVLLQPRETIVYINNNKKNVEK